LFAFIIDAIIRGLAAHFSRASAAQEYTFSSMTLMDASGFAFHFALFIFREIQIYKLRSRMIIENIFHP
jgi:hypothetical protein